MNNIVDSKTAGVDLSAKQYYAVKLSAADTVNLATATTNDAFVLLNDPESGEAAAICLFGRCKVKIGGNVSVNSKLGVDTDGMLVAKTIAGTKFFARALEAGVDGDIIDAYVFPSQKV